MKPRDIILEQIHHHETDIVPYTLGIDGEVAEQLDAHYGGPEWRDRLQTFIKSACAVDTMQKTPTDREGFSSDLFGSLWRIDRRPLHLETPGLSKASLDGYRWPEPEDFFVDDQKVADARQFCEEQKEEYFLTGWLGWGLFETSWGLRGFENILMDFAAEPDFVEELLDRITDQFLAYVEFTCRNLPGIDAVMFGDDWGDQRGVIIGPERWRKLMKPRYARIYDAVHAHGKLAISHCCGSIDAIMPDVIEIGLDVLESVQPEAGGMNPYDLKKRWGDKITFWGCLGSQSTLPFGTPAEIHAEVKRLRKEMGKGGGFILAPAKPLQPKTPIANAVAAVEAFSAQ